MNDICEACDLSAEAFTGTLADKEIFIEVLERDGNDAGDSIDRPSLKPFAKSSWRVFFSFRKAILRITGTVSRLQSMNSPRCAPDQREYLKDGFFPS
jgi:hypothetical protein